MGSATSLLKFRSHSHFSIGRTDLPIRPAFVLRHTQPAVCLAYPPASPHCSNGPRWYWNFNQLSIAYGLRPRLRSRLTLSGRSFLRKPWVFGGQDSHLSFRVAYQHSHFSAVHGSLRYRFYPLRTLPYHCLTTIHSFGDELEPRYIFGAEPLDQ